MKAYVFTDKAIERYAGQFVWLSIDTENATNAGFLKKFPIRVWPTLLIIDPRKENVLVRYAGGATVPQFSKLLDDARRTFAAKTTTGSDALLATADQLLSEQKPLEAAKAYESAIEKAPERWPGFGRAAESLTLTLLLEGEAERCVTHARALYPKLAGTPPGASVATNGLSCSLELKADHAGRAEQIAYFEPIVRGALEDPKLSISDDDRSGLYQTLVGARDDAKDEAGARRLREEWASFLEGAAGSAATPEQRSVYDSHRLTVYLELGQPEKAVPFLQQSARDFPDDYNPYARLAAAYRAMGRLDDAIAASEIALSKVYGPRTLLVMRTRADIFLARGNRSAARFTLQEAIRYAKALPQGQRSDRTIAALEKRLSDIPR